jgi:hypothetical protein
VTESNRLEYKRELTDGLEKEVVAFLNAREGGTLYLGIDKDGHAYGVAGCDGAQLAIKDRLKNNIQPRSWGFLRLSMSFYDLFLLNNPLAQTSTAYLEELSSSLAWEQKKEHRKDKIDSQELNALKPVGLSAIGDKGGDHNSHEDEGGLSTGEGENKGLRGGEEARQDQHRRYKKSDLNTAADGDTHGQVHPILAAHHDGRAQFGSTSNHRQHDETDKYLGYAEVL